ncbi:MAG: ribonuclease HII [Gemmatimonadetes bacterium]|nr:ribonuclease HII [Gemmatimonadota bacterium]
MAHRRSPRLQDLLSYERGCWSRGLCRIAGVDEVGRGPLAGPVVAAAVVLRRDVTVPGADDSKRLPAALRERLFGEIMERAAAVGIGAASVKEIDRTDILRATVTAMARALESLAEPPDHVVVDGLPVPGLGWEHEAVVGGDALIHSVACASIVAKVARDRLMRRLASRYPGYGWAENVGYGTPDHLDALRALGPTPHHRDLMRTAQLDLGLDA